MQGTTGARQGALVAGRRGAAPGPGGDSRDGAGAVPCRGISCREPARRRLSRDEQRLVETVVQAVRQAIGRKLRRVSAFCRLDSEDVSQEALLAVCRAARTYRPDHGAFAPYAQTAALVHMDLLCRRASVRQRQAGSARLTPLLEEPVAPSRPISPLVIERALGCLPDREAAAVRLHLAGWSRAEIASALGTQITQVYNLMTQARDRLCAVASRFS